MQILTLYLSTAAIFLVVDAVMLKLHLQPLFQRQLGDGLLESPRMLAAALFYFAYIAGLLYLVSVPALKAGTGVLVPAAILGAMAYGTFEFTSYAIMRDWSLQMVVTDVIWGTVLTGFAAWAGLAVTRALHG